MSQRERMSVLVFLLFLMGWRDYQMGVESAPRPEVNHQELVLLETSRGNQDCVGSRMPKFCSLLNTSSV